MANQIKGLFEARQLAIKQYLEMVKEVLRGFDTYTIEHVRINQNKKANALSKLASVTFEHLTKEVLVEVLAKRSINDKEFSKIKAEKGESWMTPIHKYLLSGLLPKDRKKARKIRVKASQYKLIKGGLYKNSYLTPRLRCIGPSQSDNIIKEIHEGSCGFNMEPRFMVVRVMKQGYYWPSMHRDATRIIQDCMQCQEYSKLRKIPSKDAISVSSTWSTLSRNSQSESPFALTNGSEAIIPSAASLIPLSKEKNSKAKRKEGEEREVASIEEAYH
ncbi:reverse transcriptase domain-containing protein [Tanacetum coccineum]